MKHVCVTTHPRKPGTILWYLFCQTPGDKGLTLPGVNSPMFWDKILPRFARVQSSVFWYIPADCSSGGSLVLRPLMRFYLYGYSQYATLGVCIEANQFIQLYCGWDNLRLVTAELAACMALTWLTCVDISTLGGTPWDHWTNTRIHSQVLCTQDKIHLLSRRGDGVIWRGAGWNPRGVK